MTLPVQVNGKRRAEIAVPAGSDAATIEALVLQDPAVRRALNGGGAAAAGRGARPDRQCGGLRRAVAPRHARPPRARRACGFTPLYGEGAPGVADGRAGSRSAWSTAQPGFAMRERLTGGSGPPPRRRTGWTST